MTNKLTEFGAKAKDAVEKGMADERTQAAIAQVKAAGTAIGNEAAKVGKWLSKSAMVKDAAAGAAVGALIAIPIPVIGPMGGAAVGAMLGVYRNLTRSNGDGDQPMTPDMYAELTKLDDLRQKGILTDAEFDVQKKKILSQA